MTDTKKRLLPWEDDDWNWSVKTKIGDLSVVRDDESGEWLAKWVYFDDDDTIGRFANAELAMDACEADYLSRCTEFLRLAGPGECVVKVEDVAEVTDFVEGIWGDRELKNRQTYGEFPSKSIDRLTAAIDAASKGEA